MTEREQSKEEASRKAAIAISEMERVAVCNCGSTFWEIVMVSETTISSYRCPSCGNELVVTAN